MHNAAFVRQLSGNHQAVAVAAAGQAAARQAAAGQLLTGKHKEAFSALVESLTQMTHIDLTNFFKLVQFTI